MKFYNPGPDFFPEYQLKIPYDPQNVSFNSKFESGNLKKAIKVSSIEYNLVLENDIGS